MDRFFLALMSCIFAFCSPLARLYPAALSSDLTQPSGGQEVYEKCLNPHACLAASGIMQSGQKPRGAADQEAVGRLTTYPSSGKSGLRA
jgi:hypothetical protein